MLVGTQTIGRPLGLALALLIGVVAAEEMPRSSRAYALSVLALAGGLGAGVAVAALRLADLGTDGWRLVYLLSLIWLLPAYSLTRHLPETHRFEQRHAIAPPLDRRRFAIIAIVAISANLFVAPASFFQNRYLDDVRGYTGGGIALFTLCTATPASLGLIVGGRLADMIGRRVRLGDLHADLDVADRGHVQLRAARRCGCSPSPVACWPAPPIRPSPCTAPSCSRPATAAAPTASSPPCRWPAAASACCWSARSVHSGWSYGQSMLVVGFGQLLAATVAFIAYPETAHLELEQINPQDALTES